MTANKLAVAAAALVGLAACGDSKDKAEPKPAEPSAPKAANTADAPPASPHASVEASNDSQHALKAQAIGKQVSIEHGPMIEVANGWRSCKKTSDCTIVASSCGFNHVAVNQAAAGKAKAAWKKVCAGNKAGAAGALSSQVGCVADRCVSVPSTGEFARLLASSNNPSAIGDVAGGTGTMAEAVPLSQLPKLMTSLREVKGPLDREIVRRVFRQERREVQYCGNRTLPQGEVRTAKARVDASFVIGADGKTTDVKAESKAIKNLGRCVDRALERMRFPAPKGGTVQVNVRFLFN